MNSRLNDLFEKAVQRVSVTKEDIAPDNLLRLYAYYKQATRGDSFSLNTEDNIRSAFKFNAWIQLNGMTADEAKQKYIELVNATLK